MSEANVLLTSTETAGATDATDMSHSYLHRVRTNPLAIVASTVITVVLLIAIVGPFVIPWDPTRAAVGDILVGPGTHGHILGTDGSGRDILSRLVYGARITLLASALAILIAVAIGIPTGLVAGYFQGWFDAASDWAAGLIMSLPALIVLLAVIAVVGPGMYTVMAVFGVVLSPGVYRLTRSGVSTVRNELYVDAARVSGLSTASIISRHILAIVRPPLMIQAAMMVGLCIMIQAGIEFLGVGDPNAPSWGSTLSDAFTNIYRAPVNVVWPAIAIGATAGSFSLLGVALRDATQTESHGVRRGTRSLTFSLLPGDGERVLAVADLAVGYPRPGRETKVVVRDVDLHVDRGEVLGVVGESGSGKSQTAFALLDLLPTGGSVLNGRAEVSPHLLMRGHGQNSSVTGRSLNIGYVPQEPMSNLDPTFTIGYQLVEPMRHILGISRRDARERALGLLRRVGIREPERVFASYPFEISGGMAQRVLIAGAVSCDPDLLIADEPTTALDVSVQADVLDLLRSLMAERDMALIIVTHNFGVVADICDRVTVMRSGEVVETGEVREVIRTPQHEYTKTLLASSLEGAAPRAPREQDPDADEETDA